MKDLAAEQSAEPGAPPAAVVLDIDTSLPGSETGADIDASFPLSETDAADERLDEEFRAADFPGKTRLLQEACKAQSLDAEYLREWFWDVSDAAKTEPERRAFGECVDILRDARPEVYQEIAGRLLELRLNDALKDNRTEEAKRLFLDLSHFAPQVIDAFFKRADQLAYRGFLQTLLDGFRTGWPLVRESHDVLSHGIEEYAETGATFEILHSLDDPSQGDGKGSDWAKRIREFWGSEGDGWEPAWRSIHDRGESAWNAEDFRITRKAFRKDKGDRHRFEARLRDFLNAFLGWLHREKGMAFTRANLARDGMYSYLRERLDGGLSDVAFLEQPPYKDHPLARILCPDRETLDNYLTGHFSLLGPRVHRALALFEAVPPWLEFLVKSRLLDEDPARRIFDDLSRLFPTFRQGCDGPWASDGDWPALERAWRQPA